MNFPIKIMIIKKPASNCCILLPVDGGLVEAVVGFVVVVVEGVVVAEVVLDRVVEVWVIGVVGDVGASVKSPANQRPISC